MEGRGDEHAEPKRPGIREFQANFGGPARIALVHHAHHEGLILRALKKYGMILADNGSNWYVSGAPDSRWDDNDLNTLKALRGSDFEVVKMGTVVTQ